MPRVNKGKKGRKNAKSSKKQAKCKTRKRAEIELPAPMVDVKVKFDPDDQTFTYRDAEKVAEADNDACGHQVMSVSEYVRSVRPELVRDIKPKIEPVIKEEPLDDNSDPDPEIDVSNKKSTKCSICHKIFKDSNGLSEHKYVHREKTLKCDICDKLFGQKGDLNKHKKIHLPNRELYPCDICQKEFQTKDGLKKHRSIHDTKRKLYECRICEKKFTLANNLKRHIRHAHENNEKLTCTFCEKEFKTNHNLIAHMRSEHFSLLRHQDKGTGDLHEVFKGIRTYECFRCGQTGFKCKVKRHMLVCRGKRQALLRIIKCELCPIRLTSKSSLKCHMRTVHSIHLTTEAIKNLRVEKQHKCTFCDNRFSQRHEQIAHIRTKHFNLLRQRDKGTSDLHELFQGIRTYECYRCKYSTGFISAVKKHMDRCKGIRIHRPFKCELCDKRFKSILTLENHMRHIHSIYKGKWEREQMLKEAERTFECIDCKAIFITKITLIQHIKFNCKKRVFKCDYCPEKLQRQTDKDEHHRRVHPILLQNSYDQKYECHICKVSILARRAIQHLATQHQIKTVFKLNICRLKSPE